MQGIKALLIFALHGSSLLGKSEALHAKTVSRRRNGRRAEISPNGINSPFSDRSCRTISDNDRSMIRIRGGSREETGATTTSSLDGIPRSFGIVDGSVPLGILASINSFFKYHPFLAAFVICAVKASSADCFAQFASFRNASALGHNNKHLDDKTRKSVLAAHSTKSTPSSFCFKRNLALLFYGGLYQGCGQELIYNNLFSCLFGTGTHLGCVLKKVSMDMFVIQPFLALPIAYLIKAPIFGQTLGQSLQNYVEDVKHRDLLKQCWKVWVPAQTIIFTAVPTHLRITCMACVSFFWIILFSSISAASSSSSTDTTTSTATNTTSSSVGSG